jgi:hypothetical protein
VNGRSNHIESPAYLREVILLVLLAGLSPLSAGVVEVAGSVKGWKEMGIGQRMSTGRYYAVDVTIGL